MEGISLDFHCFKALNNNLEARLFYMYMYVNVYASSDLLMACRTMQLRFLKLGTVLTYAFNYEIFVLIRPCLQYVSRWSIWRRVVRGKLYLIWTCVLFLFNQLLSKLEHNRILQFFKSAWWWNFEKNLVKRSIILWKSNTCRTMGHGAGIVARIYTLQLSLANQHQMRIRLFYWHYSWIAGRAHDIPMHAATHT